MSVQIVVCQVDFISANGSIWIFIINTTWKHSFEVFFFILTTHQRAWMNLWLWMTVEHTYRVRMPFIRASKKSIKYSQKKATQIWRIWFKSEFNRYESKKCTLNFSRNEEKNVFEMTAAITNYGCCRCQVKNLTSKRMKQIKWWFVLENFSCNPMQEKKRKKRTKKKATRNALCVAFSTRLQCGRYKFSMGYNCRKVKCF